MEEEEKVFELNPLSKWKRILLSLGDFFICFILAFTLFNIAVFPLAKVICQTQNKNAEAQRLESRADQLLIDNGIIYKSFDESFASHVNYTFKVFLSYYCFDNESPSTEYPQYGHKIENEVIRTYLVNIKGTINTYMSSFKEYNTDGMFSIGEDPESITLLEDYKVLLSNELLEIKEESQYSSAMIKFRDNVFARLFYLKVYKDIQTNDFVAGGVSYNALLNQVKSIMISLQWVATGATLVAMVLAWGIVYLLYPLLNGYRRTMTMSIMKADKLKSTNLGFINRKTVLLQSFYYLLLALSSSMFLPILYFGAAYTFNLPLLFVFSAISLILAIVSLFIILFNQYNRSGSDILTYTVIVPTSELDRLYREKYNG